MRASTTPVYHCTFGCLRPPLVPRYLWQVAGKLLYHNPRTPAVSPADPLDTQGASVTSRRGLGPVPNGSVPQGAAPKGYPARTAHHRLKPMKHDLTLDQVKKEARDLLRGLQRRDPEALRRCHAIDPLTDLPNPALDHARHTIAREHFSTFLKLPAFVRQD